MLVVEGLTCRFGAKAAVDNASFSIAPGGFVGVIGRSGAGKSTLLRMINRLATPTEPISGNGFGAGTNGRSIWARPS